MENDNEYLDSLTLDEDEGLDETPEVDVDKLKETNKRLYERAKKAEQALKANRPSEITHSETTRTVGVSDEVIDLRLDGYSKDEVEFIIRNGGRKALEDKASFVTIALETKREQARAEAAANQVQDTSQLTEVERKFTPEQLKNMSVEELKNILPHA